jgi:hypothetical protein
MNSTRSALILTLGGLIGAGFFYLTDPSLGYARYWTSSAANPLDIAHQAWAGTVVGLAGSGVVVVIGLWLLTRRSA